MEAPLDIARRHVIRAEQIVANQERLVAAYLWRGLEVQLADALLDAFRSNLRALQEHLAWEEERATATADRSRSSDSSKSDERRRRITK